MIRRRIEPLGLHVLMAAGASAACAAGAPGDRSAPVRTDSAGVEIVSSPAVDRPLPWTFEPILRLGGAEDGPESFTAVGVANFGVDADGRLYVMDRHSSRVVVFAPDGSFVHALGSAGEGPGELRFPIGMSVSPAGITAVFDVGKMSLVEFGAAGELLPQVPFPHSTEPGVRRHFERTDDGYTVAKGFGGPSERDVELLSWGGDARSDTVSFTRMELGVPEMVDFGCMGLALQPLFTPVIQWDAGPDAVAVIASASYAVDLYRPDGTPVRSIRRDIPPRPATEALALEEAGTGLRMQTGAGLCEAAGPDVVAGRGFADRVPALADVLLGPSGELWVERWEPGARTGDGAGPIDVFDASGAYLGTLPEGSPFPLAVLPGDRIAVSERDALDIERLVVLQIRREAAEARQRDP